MFSSDKTRATLTLLALKILAPQHVVEWTLADKSNMAAAANGDNRNRMMTNFFFFRPILFEAETKPGDVKSLLTPSEKSPSLKFEKKVFKSLTLKDMTYSIRDGMCQERLEFRELNPAFENFI